MDRLGEASAKVSKNTYQLVFRHKVFPQLLQRSQKLVRTTTPAISKQMATSVSDS